MKFSRKDILVMDAFCLVAKESKYRTDISMTKIAEKLGISRQALVKTYFKNVNEIIGSLHYFVDQEIRELISDLATDNIEKFLDDFAYQALPVIYEKRDYLSVLYGNVADPGWYGFLENTYFEILSPYFGTTSRKNDVLSGFLTRMAIRQIICILSSWLTSPNPESPLLFSKKFIYLTTHSVYDLMERRT
ncbi:MAG: hypothetical protein LBV19_04855 [Streptococcaceae bacterium]|jgi:predicted DNA-binding protein YlxM (UPF0122 family)|nr:hypothetical protein [Streptococcaceae bacterium]